MAGQQFTRISEKEGQLRYCLAYEYASEPHDLCQVCLLAYTQACKVKRCPLVLVEDISSAR